MMKAGFQEQSQPTHPIPLSVIVLNESMKPFSYYETPRIILVFCHLYSPKSKWFMTMSPNPTSILYANKQSHSHSQAFNMS